MIKSIFLNLKSSIMIAASLLASISRNAGGLFNSVRRLHQELELLPGMQVPVFGLEDEFSGQDCIEWQPLALSTSRVFGPRAFGYSPRLLRNLLASKVDILQVHGIWQYPSLVSSSWHRRTHCPYIVSPHGMLDPWAVKNAHWKKVLARVLYEGRHLNGAACIRALCQSEVDSIRAYGLKNSVCIIPNGVDLPEWSPTTAFAEDQRNILLFLGRLHPKKGIPNALRAWKSVIGQKTGNKGHDGWEFVIAGWDQGGHEDSLKRLCVELNLPYVEIAASDFIAQSRTRKVDESTVLFVGPAFGPVKDRLLQLASAFILPSFSEGLPMSVLEAWAYCVPVMMTDYCNLPEGFSVNAAIRITPKIDDIAEGLRELLSLSKLNRIAIGVNGRRLVERQFTWPMIAVQMNEVYDWVLGGGVPPSCLLER